MGCLAVAAHLALPCAVTAGEQQGEWLVYTSTGVEQRAYPALVTADVGLPEPVEVASAVTGTGQGKRLTDLHVVVREGTGGVSAPGPATESVLCLAEDAAGNLWVGTDRGLSRFDGETWTTFTQEDGLGSNLIGGLQVDMRGDLWLGTTEAITRYDGQRWMQYTVPGLPGGAFIAMAPNGDLWFAGGGRYNRARGTEGLLFRFDGQDWWEYGPEDGIPFPGPTLFVAVDRAGVVWANVGPDFSGTTGSAFLPPYEVTSFDGERWVSYKMPDMPDVEDTGYAPPHVIHADPEGRIWLGTGLYLLVFDGRSWRWYVGGRRWASILAMADASRGGVWISGLDEMGLLRGSGWAYVRRTGDFRLHPRALLVDHRGDLWMGGTIATPALVRWPAGALPTSVTEPSSSGAPRSFGLLPSYPNPFNSSTSIPFTVAGRQRVSVRILGATGQLVASLAEGSYAAGLQQLQWDGRDDAGRAVASGVYVCRLAAGGMQDARKLTLVR